jgi:hypothetical protein
VGYGRRGQSSLPVSTFPPSHIPAEPSFISCLSALQSVNKKKQTPWSESASEPYRPSDRRLSAKLLPTFVDRGCHVVSVTDPYSRTLGFLDLQSVIKCNILLNRTRRQFMVLTAENPDRLCGLVVRVLGYRCGGPDSIPGTTKKKVVGL